MEQLTQCEPMTISRAQCIYRHLSTLYKPHDLRRVLLSMALPDQRVAMDTLLVVQGDIPVHPTFDHWVQQVVSAQRATSLSA